jgi:molybdopterin-containing oxidoreductase family membrane subunit
MGLTFSKIEGNSKNFKILLILFAGFTAIGFICFMMSYISGHHVLGSSNIIPWGMPITITIYLIGLSAGSLILSSLTYVFRKEEYRPIARLAVFLAIILIFGAMIGIALDLGRPEKSWRLFMFFVLNNMRSMFALNGILYGGYFLIGIVYLGAIFAEKYKFVKTMGIIAICWAALVHMGTGAIFGFIATRPIFYSPIKPFEFLAAAMVSGLALLMIMVVLTFKFVKRNFDRNIIFSLSKLLLILIIALAVMVLIDKLTHLYPPDREPTIWLFTGPFSWIFWGLQVGFAYVLPIILLALPRVRKDMKWVMVAAVLVVVGIFGERFSLVIPGTAYPLPFYPGKIEGIWGMAGSFPITPVESFMSLGIFTLMGLLFLVGLKNLELLPVGEVGQQTPEVAKKT